METELCNEDLMQFRSEYTSEEHGLLNRVSRLEGQVSNLDQEALELRYGKEEARMMCGGTSQIVDDSAYDGL
ncbi:hypothetical protein TRAPUB_10398 [Trametes pubescens]|uniref:Uncharacterized protein n=1 Tax=Trametes pubescens TaxID=154538 RepID=A0A1M2VZP9_TRAPU|nr:hypothetical protein TRAPUB_10398 [Trametes pubescens]